MDAGTVTTGVTSDGVRYLELFMQAYSKEFGEKVNPGCNKCISDYLIKYKKRMKKSDNICGYVLHEKYENMPLEFGSQIFVNNENITDEYAKTLLSHPNGERYFSQIPEVIESNDEYALLHDAVIKAENIIAAFGPKVQQNTREKAAAKLKAAQDALYEYQEKNKLIIQDDVDQIEVVLTEEHFNDAPDLADAGYKVGDKVKAETNSNDELTIIGLVTEKPE